MPCPNRVSPVPEVGEEGGRGETRGREGVEVWAEHDVRVHQRQGHGGGAPTLPTSLQSVTARVWPLPVSSPPSRREPLQVEALGGRGSGSSETREGPRVAMRQYSRRLYVVNFLSSAPLRSLGLKPFW